MATMIEPDEMVILEQLGAKIQEYRGKAGISQRELAERSGVDRAFLNRVEKGMRRPTIYVLVRLAEALGTTVSALTRGIGTT